MRPALGVGRLCLRQTPLSQCLRHLSRSQPATRFFTSGGNKSYSSTSNKRGWKWEEGSQQRRPPGRHGLVLAAAASLSPAVFVQLSEKDNGGTEQTSEGRMLEASRAEIQKKVDDDVQGFRRVRQSVLLFLDLYVWEPICTGLRFLHLVVIFVPVMVAVPAIWFGRRQKGRDGERSGTLWWYGFLVRGMERAGPAFIKVCVFSFW